jgi:diacylglycerol kinase family enzyme
VIYNPVAGRLVRHPDQLRETLRELRRQFGTVEEAPTTGPNTATDIARACVSGGADLVVVAGGDGTLNEVLNGLIGSGVACAQLPGGTANVLSVETGAGRRLVRSASRVSRRVPAAVPLGRLTLASGESRHFLLMAGAGIDAQIVNEVNPKIKRRLGKVAYWIGGFSLLGKRLNEFEVRMNGATYRVSFALMSRVRNFGGDLNIARGAELLVPEFEAVLFEGSNSFRYMKYFAGVLAGTHGSMRGVHVLHGNRAEIHPLGTPVPVQVDGESAGELPVTVEVAAERVTMLLPERFVRRRVPVGAREAVG